jgi:hypothetical protein
VLDQISLSAGGLTVRYYSASGGDLPAPLFGSRLQNEVLNFDPGPAVAPDTYYLWWWREKGKERRNRLVTHPAWAEHWSKFYADDPPWRKIDRDFIEVHLSTTESVCVRRTLLSAYPEVREALERTMREIKLERERNTSPD